MTNRSQWTSIAMIAAMVLGGAGIASAGQDSDDKEHRRHAIHARDFVWQQPSEEPYALTGERADERTRETREDEGPRFELNGRAGLQYR